MFIEYLKKILPIPIKEIKASKDGYKYLITTYSSAVNDMNDIIEQRIRKNKRIKAISGWFFKEGDIFYKQAVIEFVKK